LTSGDRISKREYSNFLRISLGKTDGKYYK
jgi:hypothetical protein